MSWIGEVPLFEPTLHCHRGVPIMDSIVAIRFSDIVLLCTRRHDPWFESATKALTSNCTVPQRYKMPSKIMTIAKRATHHRCFSNCTKCLTSSYTCRISIMPMMMDATVIPIISGAGAGDTAIENAGLPRDANWDHWSMKYISITGELTETERKMNSCRWQWRAVRLYQDHETGLSCYCNIADRDRSTFWPLKRSCVMTVWRVVSFSQLQSMKHC